MDNDGDDADATYEVVVNDEDQYSIWCLGHDRAIPKGWRGVGFSGPKDTCLDHVESVWTDMRPKSLRELLDREQASRSSTMHSATD